MTVSPAQLLFAAVVEPLPFIDPTLAAQRLGIERHSLACYRSLGVGPAWYKFGRWVRYLPQDLDTWRRGHCTLPHIVRLVARSADNPQLERALIDTPSAACFLTVTRHCLINYRLAGTGPPSQHLGRRHYYCVGELAKWAEAQRMENVGRLPDGLRRVGVQGDGFYYTHLNSDGADLSAGAVAIELAITLPEMRPILIP